jgi:transcriptional regulator GlxA family with amidase domain
MKIFVLVIEGVFDTGLASVLDAFALANLLATPKDRERYEVEVIGVRKKVKTQHGLSVPVRAAKSAKAPDLVFVPALGAKAPEPLSTALTRPDALEAIGYLQSWSRDGARLAAACTGTYLLAASGLLDGSSATTTWWLAPDFKQRFPQISLSESHMIVATKRCITAGAALAHIDLALWVVRQKSPSLARVIARHLLLEERPSQAAFSMPDYLAHSDPIVEKFESFARAHLSDFSLSAAVRAVGASERTLERRVRHTLGRSPISFVQDLRVEAALHRIETSTQSIDEIAQSVGYQDGTTLRTLLRNKTGHTVRSLRNRRASEPK